MWKRIDQALKTALAVGLAAGTLASVASPASAGDGGAIAAGIIGGAALGAIVGSAAAAPPPPPYYPAYAPPPPPPHCWWERQSVWDGYGYVPRRVRVCD